MSKPFKPNWNSIKIILPTSAIVIAYVVLKYVQDDSKNHPTFDIYQILAVSFAFFGTGLTLFRYLQDNSDSNAIGKPELFEAIAKVQLEIATLKKKSNNDFDIKSAFDNYVKTTLTDNELLNLINSKFGDNIRQSSILSSLDIDFKILDTRLEREIKRLTKSANLNLVFGSLTTLIAVGFLGAEVYKNELKFTEIVPLLSHYIPRLAIVIFVEIFAFFFLKIYRTNLIDIKYFHNEKTNVEAKYIALKTSINIKMPKATEKIILELSVTERNFTLKKGETTIELEKEKIEVQSNKNIIDALKDIVKK